MDYSRYSEPVVLKNYSDPRPREPHIPLPDTSFDAKEARSRAMTGVFPSFVFVGVFGIFFAWLPLWVLGWVFNLSNKQLAGTWAVVFVIGVVYVWLEFRRETQRWLTKLANQADATILYMQSRVPASVQVDSAAEPVIHARPVQGGYSAREKKVARLAYWIRRAIENKGNADKKPGPRLMRNDWGEYHVTIPVTQEQVDQPQQQADYSELVDLGFLVLDKGRYRIKDLTWTVEQAAELLAEALRG
jgi:hypothetical protein